MIKVKNANTYEKLKASFIDGIEFKRIPLEAYLEKHSAPINVSEKILADTVQDIFVKTDDAKMIKSMAHVVDMDWDIVGEKLLSSLVISEILQQGQRKLAATFNRGIKDPAICFMAWYDALAEYVLSVANSLIGEEAPIPAIQEELKDLSTSLSENFDFNEAKKNVYNSLKKMYPKTYKKRLKLIEQGYDTKVRHGINEIVGKLVKP